MYVTWQDWKNEKEDLPSKIYQIPLTGGAPKEIAIRQHAAHGVVATKAAIFWLVSGGESDATRGSVMKLPLTGGRPTAVAKAFVLSDSGLIGDDDNLYFGDVDSADQGQLFKMPLSGGKRQVIVPKTGDDDIDALDVDKASVYWVSVHEIMKIPLGGGPAVALVRENISKTNVWGMASDGAHLYWTDRNNEGLANHQPDESQFPSAIHRVPVDGGAVETVADHQRYRPFGIAVDATHVYWAINAEIQGGIMRMPKTGGTPMQLVSMQRSPAYLALDDSYVYWCNSGNGFVSRVSKGD